MSDLLSPFPAMLLIVLIWAATELLKALMRFIRLYVQVRDIRHEVIWFAGEIAKYRFGRSPEKDECNKP